MMHLNEMKLVVNETALFDRPAGPQLQQRVEVDG